MSARSNSYLEICVTTITSIPENSGCEEIELNKTERFFPEIQMIRGVL